MSGIVLLDTREELEDNISEIKRLNLVVDLNQFKSTDSIKNIIKNKYCGEIFFISIPEISDLTYLPMYYPDCGPIIDISSDQVQEINTLEDIYKGTKEFKLLSVPLDHFTTEELKKIFIKIVIDYKQSVDEYLIKNNLNLTNNNLEEISKVCPFTIWVTLEEE
ncbi:hypothetical protein [Cyclobacterium marinum]|uniref:hypothetical protein n=1 Tax=Cyclobacterium marinum TaxID=104 RepID=UPI0011ECAED0|nr:hypothetical protein [Cyclobacterium marinum]MBI0400422.1 hypothetical protein [Cyclobacterium marinum]